MKFDYKKYPKGTLESLNASMPKELYDWVVFYADDEGLARSHVIQAAVRCFRHVLSLFGKDYEEQLKIQADPIWVKELRESQLKILTLIEGMEILTVQEKSEMVEEIKAGITPWVGDLLE